jgi:Relaxase/Mobilisation nuclease domain
MNWAKGRKTRGRGTSFKGALVYALHDKDAATKDRVGFVELRNLATDNPDRAWSEMMALCEAADDLKRRAGGKATGRKLTQPVYAFTLNWHEDDRPDAAHMKDTALDALKALGMDGLQAVIIEHTDRPHRHVHVIVNLVDPDTGKAASLSNDEHKLDRWADNYEVKQGVIRSPDRRAKFDALDNGLPPPKRKNQADTREEWEATRGQNGREAKEKAAEIRAAFAARIAGLKETNEDRYRKSRAEGDRLWNSYKADKKAIGDRYQPFIDAIFKSTRKSPPHPYTEQAFRDLEETSEWKEFGRRQFQQRKAFKVRERHSLGASPTPFACTTPTCGAEACQPCSCWRSAARDGSDCSIRCSRARSRRCDSPRQNAARSAPTRCAPRAVMNWLNGRRRFSETAKPCSTAMGPMGRPCAPNGDNSRRTAKKRGGTIGGSSGRPGMKTLTT